MKEQVILDRAEYLKLKEMADMNQEQINKLEKERKAYYIRNLFDTIYTGMYDGFHRVTWGQERDWKSVNITWDNWCKWLKNDIEKEDWDDALTCLQKAIDDITKENRLHTQNEDVTNQMADEVKEKIDEFNSIPWYKKMFYKI